MSRFHLCWWLIAVGIVQVVGAITVISREVSASEKRYNYPVKNEDESSQIPILLKVFFLPVDPLQLIKVGVRVVKQGICHGGNVSRRRSISLTFFCLQCTKKSHQTCVPLGLLNNGYIQGCPKPDRQQMLQCWSS